MKVGGSELGCNGNLLRWVMSSEVKLIVADSVPFQANCPEVGEAPPLLLLGVWPRDRSLGRGWARGTQLSVCIVRKGIS